MRIVSSGHSHACLPHGGPVAVLYLRLPCWSQYRPFQTAHSSISCATQCRARDRGRALAATATASDGALQPRRELFPSTAVVEQGCLQVSSLHKVVYAVYGNPDGIPAVVVHGGPGAGCWPNHARFFNPAIYRIVLMDQRGCGASSPRGCLADNTTAALVSDLEAVRHHLDISQWLLLGGSWGVTLALAYAQRYPERVLGLILRGVCLMRPSEITWMYGGGAGMLQPLAWHTFVHHVSPAPGGGPCQDVLLAYYERLLSPDPAVRNAAAQSWMQWEMAVGFSHHHELLHWDGRAWSSEQRPAAAPAKPTTSSKPGKAAVAQQAPRATSTPRTTAAFTGAARSKSPSAVPTAKGAATLPPFNARSPVASPTRAPPLSPMTCEGEIFRMQAAAMMLSARIPADLAHRAASYCGDDQMSSFAAQALLECHYSIHGAFLVPPRPPPSPAMLAVDGRGTSPALPASPSPLSSSLLHPDALAALRARRVPCIAVQGQRDLVCPPGTAYELHRAWPEMVLRLVPDAGHSMYDPAIRHELLEATDGLARLILTSGP